MAMLTLGDRARVGWLLVLAFGANVAAEQPARTGGEALDATLSAKDLQTSFEPYVPEVRTCYLAHARGKAADGTLRLELIVHPTGTIFKLGFAAPGVDKPWLGKLDACLRTQLPTWHLPARTRFTTAVLPFLFQKTAAPGAGPLESCWDPRGCPPGRSGGAK